MTDNLRQIGKYFKNTGKNADLAIKRSYITQPSSERIRDIFDPEYPFSARIATPSNVSKVTLALNFGKRLPSVGCCGDCFCGTTESYTSDSLIGNDIYTGTPYVPNSTVVYLDGVIATRNTDYIESNPDGRLLEILIPFSVITISYVYSTGNCTETGTCVDNTHCLDFAFFSGLATVFADRFDRSATDGFWSTAGGCGYWASNISIEGVITPIDPAGNNAPGFATLTNDYALLGGGYVSGKTFEIIASGVGSVTFAGQSEDYSVSFDVSMISTTVMTLTISGQYQYKQFDAVPSFIEGTIIKSQNFTIDNWTDPIFIRAAQFPTGSWVLRVWKQEEDESLADEISATIADRPTYTGSFPVSDFELILPTIYAVMVDGTLQAIKVGAGLDTGRYKDPGINEGSDEGAWGLTICRYVPPFGSWPYFGGCGTETITSTVSANTIATYQAFIAFPVVVGDVPPNGSGRVSDISQTIGAIKTTVGKPSQIKIKGEIQATFVEPHTISAVFETYPAGKADPGYSNERYFGSQVGSVSLVTDGTWIPFEILVGAGEFNGRWGIRVASVDAFAQGLAFIVPGFLSPPSYYLTLNTRFVTFEGLENVHCTANEICGLCSSALCGNVIDGFYDESYPYFSTGSIDIYRKTLSGTNCVVEQDDGPIFTGLGNGIGRVTFSSAETSGFNSIYFEYSSPFDCRLSADYGEVEASFEFKVNTLSPVGGYAEISFGGWNDGPYFYITFIGGVVTVNNISMSVSISPNIWYTLRYRTDGDNLLLKIFPTGGTETSWTTATNALLNNPVNTFVISAGYQFSASAPNWEAEFKNINILGDFTNTGSILPPPGEYIPPSP